MPVMPPKTVRPLALLCSALLLPCAAPAFARDLTVVDYGGSGQQADRAAYVEPYIKATGSPVILDAWDGEMAKVKAMVDTGNVTWDLVQMDAAEVQRACDEGLLEKIDWSKITAKAEMMEAAVHPCGVGKFVWATALAYSKALSQAPQSWADFWNLERFPGKRAMRKRAEATLEIALLADGVPAADVYKVLATPEGQQRAFAKLDKIKPQIQWWEAGALPMQWLVAGDVVMAAAYSGRVASAKKETSKVDMTWAGNIYVMDYWAMVKGSPNRDAAYRFLAYASQADRQAAYFREQPYGPVNTKAADEVARDNAADSPSAPANLAQGLPLGVQFWIEHGEELEEKFNAWAAR